MQAATQGRPVKPNGIGRSGGLYALLAIPVLGMGSFFWIISHRVYKPDISIFDAIQAGDEKAVRDHLATGTSADSIGTDGHTALYTAIVGRKPKIVRILLDHHARVEDEGKGQPTPVFAAAIEGDIGLVKELLDKGAKADVVSRSGDTLLHAAATSGNPELVKMLLERGAKVNAVNHSGATALCHAATASNLETVRLLVEHGARVNVTGDLKRSPLHLAAQKGNAEIVQFLLQAGANADALDRGGVLPLAIALGGGRKNGAVEVLIAHTTNFRALDFSRGTLLHYAVRGSASRQVVHELLAKGVDPDQMDFQGDTPLTIARRTHQTDLEQELEAAGARVPLRHLILNALHNTQPTRGGFKGGE